jgi:RNA polymerase sigma factor (sigma-70 family)
MDARSFTGPSGPKGVARRLDAADRPRAESWARPMHPARRGIQPRLSEDQRGLATRYLPMAESLARAFEARQALERDELRSTAYLALVEAARTFDPYRKVNFATFARHRIRGALRDYARFLLSENWRGPKTHRPSFQGLGQNAEEHGRVLGISGEQPLGTEIESMEVLEQWLQRLPPMHALTCRLIYVGRKNQDEVSQLLRCSRAHVSRMHTEALSWLIDGFVPAHQRRAQSGHEQAE